MNPDEGLTLVYRAIIETCSGCCDWADSEERRVRRDPYLLGLTPEGIKKLLQDHVRQSGLGVIQQRRERREDYLNREFFYWVIVPIIDFRHGLFVEVILSDDD